MKRFGKWFLIALGSLAALLAVAITLTIGWRYRDVAVLAAADRVAPLALDCRWIAAADLLPPPPRVSAPR